MAQQDTIPASVDIGSGEVLPYGFDFSANVNIAGGETISSAVVTVFDKTENGASYPLALNGNASILLAVVTQGFFNFINGHEYTIICKIITSLSRTWQSRTTFKCVL